MTTNNYFDRQERVIGKEVGEKIKNTKILVIGAGAGGNEVLKNLALMGFGNFTIVDFDPIEDSNLSRTTLFPDCLEIDADNVTYHKGYVFGYKSTVIARNNIASVSIDSGIFFCRCRYLKFGRQTGYSNRLSKN